MGTRLLELPDWLPREAWQEFLKMRRRIRKPMTEYAKKLAIARLDRLRELGENIQAVLDRSTFNDYQGLFPVPVSQNDPVGNGAWREPSCGYITASPESRKCENVAVEFISGRGWRCAHCKLKEEPGAPRMTDGLKPVDNFIK